MLSKVWLGNSCRRPLRAIKCRSGIPPILYALALSSVTCEALGVRR